MPTYQYRCTECGRELEVVQKFTDPALTECEACNGALRKVYNAVGVVFKGSGFYRTDSRKADGNAPSGGSSEKTSSETGSGEKGAKAPVASATGATNGSVAGGSSNGSGSTPGKTPAKASSTAA